MAVGQNATALGFVDNAVKNDAAFMLEACARNRDAFIFAPKQFLGDRAFFLTVCRTAPACSSSRPLALAKRQGGRPRQSPGLGGTWALREDPPLSQLELELLPHVRRKTTLENAAQGAHVACFGRNQSDLG